MEQAITVPTIQCATGSHIPRMKSGKVPMKLFKTFK
jgi:hypothetical protein